MRKIIMGLCIALVANSFSQTPCNVSFTYTTTDSSISVISTGTSSVNHYNWSLGNNNYNNSDYSSFLFSPLYNGTYIVTLFVIDDICMNNNSTQNITVSGGVNPPPCSANFTYTFGSAGQVFFSNTSPFDSLRQTSYIWHFDSLSSHTDTTSFYYNGTHTVTLNVSNPIDGCSTSSTQTITITNATPCIPTVSFHMQQDTTTPHLWDAYPSYSPHITSAKWHWGDGTSTVGFYPSHTYSIASIYTICVTAFTGCGDSSTYCQNDSLYRLSQNNSTNSTIIQVNVLQNNTGIKQFAANNEATIYPNPTSNSLQVTFSGNIQNTTIEVYNTIGECVHRQIAKSANSQINVAGLAEGVYNISISSNEGVANKRLVIVR